MNTLKYPFNDLPKLLLRMRSHETLKSRYVILYLLCKHMSLLLSKPVSEKVFLNSNTAGVLLAKNYLPPACQE